MYEKPIVPVRKNINEDFPLHGSCHYAECNNLLAAYCSKGKKKKINTILLHRKRL